MAESISALEHKPSDFIREVSPDAIDFYVDRLSGICLPEDFKTQHAEVFGVKLWKPEDRLRGKFGRFVVNHVDEGGEIEKLEDILVMGTTVGLSSLDRYGYFNSLEHYLLQHKIPEILRDRGVELGEEFSYRAADYGATAIRLGEDGSAEGIKIDGVSLDFGRATAEGRGQTCATFRQLLGNDFQVVNAEPEPSERQRIVS